MDNKENPLITAAQTKLTAAIASMEERLVGQRNLVERLMLGLMTEGHVLLEGLPGLAKTTAVKALGETARLSVSRIQFTPDLLPADVLGTQVYDPKNGDFRVKKGPVFANLVIADEINRAPAKVQSALLEAMQERQITLGDETFRLEEPFLVMATQNPIEQEGTYPLPEAQLDRFLFKVKVTYGAMDDEIKIIERVSGGETKALEPVISREDILSWRRLVNEVYVADKVRQYIVRLVFATREPGKHGLESLQPMLRYGASPRASINLDRAARAHAILQGRSYVVPQDVKDIGYDVLRHRLLLSYEAEADNITADEIIGRIFAHIDVP